MTAGFVNRNGRCVVGRKDFIASIEKMLPDFTRACRAHNVPIVIMHQGAFAADYQGEEYRLLGMATKFAGIGGKEISIIGTNGRLLIKIKVLIEPAP
jgi:hypothetical protein